MAPTLAALQTNLKLLSDPTRLRLLALLSREELAVHELVTLTGLQQSRISNHLALLRRAGLVVDRREGSWSFHRLADSEGGLSPELFEAAVRPYLESEAGRADQKALEAVREQRRERSRRTHDRLADRWAEVGQEFATGSLRAEAYSSLVPSGLVIADLGCGAGFLTQYFAERGARVIAVDHAPRMVETARRSVGSASVEFRRGEMEQLPIATHEVDAAFANLVWHHLADVDRAAREVARVVKPGGTAVITDLLPHEEDWMRSEMGDLRLGIAPEVVLTALARAGFSALATESIKDHYVVAAKDGRVVHLPMFLVRGVCDGTPKASQPEEPQQNGRESR